MWHLELARERFRGWMRTSDTRPPFKVECSSQTPKVLPLSRAPYTTISHSIIPNYDDVSNGTNIAAAATGGVGGAGAAAAAADDDDDDDDDVMMTKMMIMMAAVVMMMMI